MSFTTPSASITQFSGLMSRCTMPRSWHAHSASVTWCMICARAGACVKRAQRSLLGGRCGVGVRACATTGSERRCDGVSRATENRSQWAAHDEARKMYLSSDQAAVTARMQGCGPAALGSSASRSVCDPGEGSEVQTARSGSALPFAPPS